MHNEHVAPHALRSENGSQPTVFVEKDVRNVFL